jgi:ribosomal protein S18 acetylase RimI-like enzyme
LLGPQLHPIRSHCVVASAVVEVRPCEQSDLAALGEALPITGPYGHAHRLREQQQDRWLYLIALDPAPIGGCLVHWAGPVDDHVRAKMPDIVEVASLHVAAEARGRGAGHALISEAERQASLRGRALIGVGVADDNQGARRLYQRLGYTASTARYRAEYEYTDEGGVRHEVVEQGVFLIKSVTPA